MRHGCRRAWLATWACRWEAAPPLQGLLPTAPATPWRLRSLGRQRCLRASASRTCWPATFTCTLETAQVRRRAGGDGLGWGWGPLVAGAAGNTLVCGWLGGVESRQGVYRLVGRLCACNTTHARSGCSRFYLAGPVGQPWPLHLTKPGTDAAASTAPLPHCLRVCCLTGGALLVSGCGCRGRRRVRGSADRRLSGEHGGIAAHLTAAGAQGSLLLLCRRLGGWIGWLVRLGSVCICCCWCE